MWKIALYIALVFCVAFLTCEDTLVEQSAGPLVVKSAGTLPNFDLSGLDGEWILTAEIKTKAKSATIVAKSKLNDGSSCGLWENGNKAGQAKMLFLRQGKLIFDIGWKWYISSISKVNDDEWHTVGVRYEEGSYILRVDQKDVFSKKSSGIPDHPQHKTSFGYNIGHIECNGDMAKAFNGSIKNIFYSKKSMNSYELKHHLIDVVMLFLMDPSHGLLKNLDFSNQNGDWELTALIKTEESSGTIVAKSLISEKNRPCGYFDYYRGTDQMFYISHGKLCFSTRSFGFTCGKDKIDDNKWHTVGVKYSNNKYILLTDSNIYTAELSIPNGKIVINTQGHVTSYGYSIDWSKHNLCYGSYSKAFKGIIKNIEYRKL